MPVVVVDNKEITFPDSMSSDEIKQVLDKQFGKPKTKYDSVTEGISQVGQGMSFGLTDEVGGAIAALVGSMQTGESFSDAYDKIQKDISSRRGQFKEDNPALATGLEVAGGLTSGGLGAAKVLGSQALRNAPGLVKAAGLAGTGAAQGGLYGAGSANPGSRVEGAKEGAGFGAAGALIGAPLANALGRVAGSVANRVGRAATATPRSDAQRVLQETADAVGLSPDEAVRRMRDLGPDAVLADVDEGMRVVGRAAANRQGPMRQKAEDLMFERDRQQSQRLLSTIEASAGSSKSFGETQKNLVQQRKEQAGPVYAAAERRGIEMSGELRDILKSPGIVSDINKMARLQGKPPLKPPTKTITEPAGRFRRGNVVRQVADPNATILDGLSPQERFQYLKFAKEGLSDQIGKAKRSGEANKVRILMEQKERLLTEMGRQNPEYIKANAIYAGASELNDALVEGRKLMSTATDFDEVADAFSKMSDSEQMMFRLGAVKSVSDKLDSVGAGRDVTKIIGPGAPAAVRKKIDLVLGDDAPEFMRRAGIEEEFVRTKQALTGNSTTALQQQAGQALDDAIDPGLLRELSDANPSNIVGKVIGVLQARKPTPEIINQLGQLLLTKGLTDKQIRNILGGSGVRRALGDDYDRVIAPFISGSVAVPSTTLMRSEAN